MALWFQGITPFALEPTSEDNMRDLRRFLEQRLASVTDGVPSEAVRRIAARSEGNFLYAEWAVRALIEGHLSLDRTGDFPPGLGGIYTDFFRRQFPDLAEYEQLFRPLLEMVSAAHSQLPLELARNALHWGAYEFHLDQRGQPLGGIVERFGALVAYQDGAIQPFHYSLLEWVTRRDSSGRYSANLSEGRKRLADACVSEFRHDPTRMSTYAAEHLPTHLMETGRWGDLLTVAMSPELGLLRKWTQGVGAEKGMACLAALIERPDNHRAPSVVRAGLATQLARICSLRGEQDSARHWLDVSVKHTSWLRGRRIRAIALHELGSLALSRSDLEAARRLYRRALRLCLWSIHVHHDEAAANLDGLATVAFTKARFSTARREATRGLREARRSGDSGHIVALERLFGAILRATGRLNEAKARFAAALQLAEASNLRLEGARIAAQLGYLHLDLAELTGVLPRNAEQWFRRASDDAEAVHDLYGAFEAEVSLVTCEAALDRTDDAEARLSRIELSDPAEAHPGNAAGLKLARARLTHRRGELALAERRYHEVIDWSLTQDLTWGVRTSLIGLGAVRWHSGRRQEAEAAWRQARTLAMRVSRFKRRLVQSAIRSCRETPRAIPLS